MSIQSINILHVGEKDLRVNQEGYLIDFNDWDEATASAMAELDHIELADYHWKMFNFIRQYYHDYEIPPSSRIMKKAIADKLNSWGYKGRTLEMAFPLGGCKHACRLAGIPAHCCYDC